MIDDATLPGGVITALKNGFGTDTRLELLPLETVATLRVYSGGAIGPVPPSSRVATLVNRGVGGSELRDAASWQLASGEQDLFDRWQSERPFPTIGELVPDKASPTDSRSIRAADERATHGRHRGAIERPAPARIPTGSRMVRCAIAPVAANQSSSADPSGRAQRGADQSRFRQPAPSTT
jgi:hypothetical protein